MGLKYQEKPKINIFDKWYECDVSNINMIEGITRDWPDIVRTINESDNYRAIALKAQREYEALVQNPDKHTKEQIQKITDEYNNTADEQIKKVLGVHTACKSFIIGSLGEEEYDMIFDTNRKKGSLSDHVSVVTYIYNWSNNERKKIIKRELDEDKKEVQKNAAGHPAQHNKRKKRRY